MADSATPGWYHAQGDPEGTERYWDGSSWTEGPRPIGGAPDTSGFSTTTPGVDTPDTSGFSTTTPGVDTPDTSGFSTTTPGVDAPDTSGFSTTTPGAPQDGFGAAAPAAAAGGFSATTPPSAPSGFPAAPGGAGAPQFGNVYPEESQSTKALIMSIAGAGLGLTGVGIILSLPLGIAGAIAANKEKKAIDAGLRDPSKRGAAVAALIIGIITAVLSLLAVLGFVILVIAIAFG